MTARQQGVEAFDLRDHGIAVRQGGCMSYCVMKHPDDERDRIYFGFNAGTAYRVVELDPETGESVQFNAPAGCQAPWGMEPTPQGTLLVTGSDGSVCELHPNDRSLRLVGRTEAWFWNICRGSDGCYYLGGCNPVGLYRFSPESGIIERIGPIDPDNKHIRLVEADESGHVYMVSGFERARAYSYRIADGTVRSLLPESEEKTGLHALRRGNDGNLYLQTVATRYYRLANGEALRVAPSKFPGFAHPALADGSPVAFLDPDAAMIGVGEDARVLPLTYEGDGSWIFHLVKGPSDAIYASTILPLYLLRYDPKSDSLENLGRGGPDNGEIYSFGHVDGKLYYATYAMAKFMVYDPNRPIRTGRVAGHGWGTPSSVLSPWDGNPRHLCDLGKGHCRTRAMHVDSKKRVWVGSEAVIECSEKENAKYHGGSLFHRGAAIVDGRYYFSCGPSVMSARLPL